MIKIKKAGEEDITDFYQLILGIAQFHDMERFILTNPSKLKRFGFGEDPKYGVLLAQKDRESIGYLSYTWSFSIWRCEEVMQIDDLFVKESYRNNQVGLRLMKEARAISQKRGVQVIKWEVEEFNESAKNFYQRLGAKSNTKEIFKWNID